MPGKLLVAPAPSPPLHRKIPLGGEVVAGRGGKICKSRGDRGAGISPAGLEGPLRPTSGWYPSAARGSLSRGSLQLCPGRSSASSLGLRFLCRRDTLCIGGGGRFCLNLYFFCSQIIFLNQRLLILKLLRLNL